MFQQADLSDGSRVVAFSVPAEVEEGRDALGRPGFAGVLELGREMGLIEGEPREGWRLRLNDGREGEIVVRRQVGADIGGSAVVVFEGVGSLGEGPVGSEM